MRAPATRAPIALCRRLPRYACRQCISATARPTGSRGIQISSAPATEFPKQAASDAFGTSGARDDADARFEVLGSPYSLLSVSLSASQKLYTRRGTLVSVAGKLENAQSTLALLAPVRRALLGLPFLYQRITSTTPLTLLIGTKAASTTLFNLHLDGTTDWVVAQRSALLAWTGHTLTVTPQRAAGSLGLGVAHWGSSFVTGRGLVALSAPGYIYPVTLAAGEELAVHPSHVVAYAVGKNQPRLFRLREGGVGATAVGSAVLATAQRASKLTARVAASGSQAASTVANRLHLQVPRASSSSPSASSAGAKDAPSFIASVARAWNTTRRSAAYKALQSGLFEARTLLRRTIWGDRLFVRIQGPTTLLLSSRGVRMAEVLSREDVNEIADADAGVVSKALESRSKSEAQGGDSRADADAVALHVATAQKNAEVAFTDAKDLKDFVR